MFCERSALHWRKDWQDDICFWEILVGVAGFVIFAVAH